MPKVSQNLGVLFSAFPRGRDAFLPGAALGCFLIGLLALVFGGALAGANLVMIGLVLPAIFLSLFALVAYVSQNFVSVHKRLAEKDVTEQRQQAAVLALLDKISMLADGDLTVRADVSFEFTGTLADSLNQTIDTLRGLVGTIHDTASDIGAAVTSTHETASLIASGSENQSREVVEISGRMKQSTESLNGVAGRAETLSQQAGASVRVARNGAITVGRSIQGMAALRQQIQDTSKRIKRLGESSQEIGNIIEFINDIAEQTNTLALNASIQAAMAGEAGKGFAVVAEEVQRLAERAAAATRQIETLIKTIQADTTEAIISMEHSTSNVITGAHSAEEAGRALTQVEESSNEVERLIRAIAGETRSEAAQVAAIAEQVQSIQRVAETTATSAQRNASSVGELTALSTKLRQSVAGFKLPAPSTAG